MSSWSHNEMYPIAINKVRMFYLTTKFHDNCLNTFGFIEGSPPPPPSPQAQELQKAQAE